MTGTAIVASGNYKLEIDTGADWGSFTLDDALRGILDGTYPLGPGTTYADVTEYAMNVNIKRGREDIGDQFTYGNMSFTLNSTASYGVLVPFNTDSPYYDPATAQPGLAPLRKVRFGRYDDTGTLQYLYVGRIVNYDVQYPLGQLSTVQVTCADDFYLLSQTFLNDWSPTEQLSSARLTALLDLPEVAYPTGATYRNISTGTTTLGGSAAYDVTAGTSAGNYVAQVNTAEQGRVFISRKGVFTFQPRIGNTLSGSVADFHDDGTALPYDDVTISYQADLVKNYAAVTHAGATSPQTAEDAASRAKYLTQTINITNSLLHNDASALTLAQYLIVGEPEARFTGVSCFLGAMTNTQRDTVAVVDIGDTITVQKNIQTGPTTYDEFAQELSVEGIQHNISFTTGHRITYFTAPTTIVYELILDDPTYGTLDALNVLG